MTRALPTRQRIHRMGMEGTRTPVSLAAELGIRKPSAPIIAIDLGTLFNKDGFLFSDETAYVEKVENFLSEVEAQPRAGSAKRGSFSQRNRRS